MENPSIITSTFNMLYIIISEFGWFILIFGLGPYIIGLIAKKSKRKRKLSNQDFSNYYVKTSLISKNELSFYETLKIVVGEKFIILSMVRLADIFLVKNSKNYYSYFQRIFQKHVDFLLCDPKTMKPVLGIEVDDRSHQNQKRKERDFFVNSVFETAGLPLLHVKASYKYSAENLAKNIIGSFNRHTK